MNAPMESPRGQWQTLVRARPESLVTFAEIEAVDAKRQDLLEIARTNSPLVSALKIRLWPHTVVPRILCRSITWIVIAAWGITVALARMGITEENIDSDIFNSASAMVTFMIIFYVGYCCALAAARRAPSHHNNVDAHLHMPAFGSTLYFEQTSAMAISLRSSRTSSAASSTRALSPAPPLMTPPTRGDCIGT